MNKNESLILRYRQSQGVHEGLLWNVSLFSQVLIDILWWHQEKYDPRGKSVRFSVEKDGQQMEPNPKTFCFRRKIAKRRNDSEYQQVA